MDTLLSSSNDYKYSLKSLVVDTLQIQFKIFGSGHIERGACSPVALYVREPLRPLSQLKFKQAAREVRPSRRAAGSLLAYRPRNSRDQRGRGSPAGPAVTLDGSDLAGTVRRPVN